jgi:hypothetical protein
LKTNTIWATNCEYLNDLSELKDIERLFSELMHTKDKKYRKYLEIYSEGILEKILKNYKKQTYIISMTEENDSVAMWKNYGKNGIVIEFDTPSIVNTVKYDEINIFNRNNQRIEISTIKRYGGAFYDDEKITEILELSYEILKRRKELNDPKRKAEMSDAIFNILVDFMYGVYIQKKDKNFSYENEFRLAYILKDENVGKVEHFRVNNNMIVPYIVIDFSVDGKLPIKSITINPEQKDFMYEDGLRHLLRTYNYDISIKHSKSKIR